MSINDVALVSGQRGKRIIKMLKGNDFMESQGTKDSDTRNVER